jgi:starvation-inducible DNA-binding protein
MKIHIGLNDSQRENIAAELAKCLADSYILYLKTHNFHWNVTGPHFAELHSLFEKQYTEISGAIDEIAERIRALGVLAPGSFSQFKELTAIEEETGHPPAEEMIKQLVEAHEQVARTARQAMPTAEEAKDAPTVDLLTRRMEVHQKNAWMLRSLLE